MGFLNLMKSTRAPRTYFIHHESIVYCRFWQVFAVVNRCRSSSGRRIEKNLDAGGHIRFRVGADPVAKSIASALGAHDLWALRGVFSAGCLVLWCRVKSER